MTFRLLILTALVAIAKGSYINGGHGVQVQGPGIGGSYVANGVLLRGESPSVYSPGYGYQVGPGRSFTGVTSTPLVVRGGYGSPYPYGGGRNYPVQGTVANYQSISAGYGGRGISYPSSPSYSSYSSSPNLRRGQYNAGGFSGGYNNAYTNGYSTSNLQNYGHQSIPFASSQIGHNHHGSFNALQATGYGY